MALLLMFYKINAGKIKIGFLKDEKQQKQKKEPPMEFPSEIVEPFTPKHTAAADKLENSHNNENNNNNNNSNIEGVNDTPSSHGIMGERQDSVDSTTTATNIFTNPENFDFRDLYDVDRREFLKHIGLVSQHTQLFNTTILENIAYGMEPEDFIETEEERQMYEKLSNNYRLTTLTDVQEKALNEYLNKIKLEKVVEACKAAQAHDFISAFPDGYHTPIMSLNNASMSGGQIQRTSIARALLRKPKLLLLDEASSALDTESEAKVQATLERIVTENRKRGAAIVMIAHRLSTIQNADRIIVIKDGQKHQEGNHQTLMQDPEGLYAQYVAKGFPKPSGNGGGGAEGATAAGGEGGGARRRGGGGGAQQRAGGKKAAGGEE